MQQYFRLLYEAPRNDVSHGVRGQRAVDALNSPPEVASQKFIWAKLGEPARDSVEGSPAQVFRNVSLPPRAH